MWDRTINFHITKPLTYPLDHQTRLKININLEFDGSIPHLEIESLLINYFLKKYIYNPCKIKIIVL